MTLREREALQRPADPIPDTNTWFCLELRTGKAEQMSQKQARTNHVRPKQPNIVSTKTVRKSQTDKNATFRIWTVDTKNSRSSSQCERTSG